MKTLSIKVGYFFILLIGLIFIELAHSAKEQPTSEIATEDKIENNNKNPAIKFSTSASLLSKTTRADEILWIDVNSNKHLILWHRAKGRKERGNVLLLHAQGENADHSRLIQPLAKQLVRLGWNLFIPSIAQEDFPIPFINKNGEETNQESPSEKGNKAIDSDQTDNSSQKVDSNTQSNIQKSAFTFENSQSYQNYFSSLYQAVFEQTEIAKQPTIVIANQNTAYWTLQCLIANKQLTPIIFLQPQLPMGVNSDLVEIFTRQTNPLFSFHLTNVTQDIFNQTFKKRLWRSKFQRFNTGMLSSSKIQLEDDRIAKAITGWVERQRKK